MKFYICSYTNKVKEYCDQAFLYNLFKVAKDNPVFIVDNTLDKGEYTKKLRSLSKNSNFGIIKHTVPPGEYQFLRNVAESVNICRTKFIESTCDYMLIIESDVIPPENLLVTLEEDISYLNCKREKWGIIGGIYYQNFHNFNSRSFSKEAHVLSGCSVYNRELIKETPFRWDRTIPGAFPDAFMSLDSDNKGYSNWNDHTIRCHHAEKRPNDRAHSGLLS